MRAGAIGLSVADRPMPAANPGMAFDGGAPPDGVGSPPDADIRRIIHVDMDAFYASVEQRDHPELRGRPVAVGGSRARGVVAAASYEARAFGVRSAMPSVTAQRKCPDLIFVKPRFDAYRAVSMQIRSIFAAFTPLVEPLSLDEAYLDVTGSLSDGLTATEIARRIRSRIRDETGLTASAGVACNKFLAKLASDHRKPDGLFVIRPEMGPHFVAEMPVGRFHGVGPATAAKLNALGVITGRDLRRLSMDFLVDRFGKAGRHFYWIARAIDVRPVRPDRVRKSIGAETTFAEDLDQYTLLAAALAPIGDKVWRASETTGARGRTVTLKVKFADFEQVTRSRSFGSPVSHRDELTSAALDLLRALFPLRKPVRLLGVTLSALATPDDPTPAQLTLGLDPAGASGGDAMAPKS
jgi:DNA polymerase-4